MSNVTLGIGGRSYVVACAPGEEAHVSALAQVIDRKVASMGEPPGQNEARTLLFAALLLADDLHERDNPPGDAAPAAAPPPAGPAPEEAIAARLDAFAGRLEKLAARLEDEPASA